MSYRIVIYTKRKGILIFISYIIAEKCLKLQSHIASLKMHRTHAHRKFQQNGFAPAHRNLLPHIATRNLLSHIASHALEITKEFWKNRHFENMRAGFLLRWQNLLRCKISLFVLEILSHWIKSWLFDILLSQNLVKISSGYNTDYI